MIKLKEVVTQLENANYKQIEKNLTKNRAESFLFLLQSYRKSNLTDKEIMKGLSISSNSLYALKSRLYDKIQENLSSDVFVDKENTLKLLIQVPEFCYNTPRETAVAYLLKLEKDLKRFDMHNELLVVYSALKKIHLNSDKYYHYSQLYNKQVSFSLSLEKAEEVLGNFCRLMNQYDFSRSTSLFEQLRFLKNEISNIKVFCNSRQIQIINNLMELHLNIFFQKNKSFESNTDELLQQTKAIFDDLPATIIYKKWEVVLDYLCFEYYYSIGSYKAANKFFEKINDQLPNFLLYNHIGFVSNFLISKLKFCSEFGKQKDFFTLIDINHLLYDPYDSNTQITLHLYNAMVYFHQKKYTAAIACLSDVHHQFVVKSCFHQFINIKLTLAYFYILAGEFDKAQKSLKIVHRRIKLENPDGYNHVIYLLKALDFEINKGDTEANNIKKRELYMLFFANNDKDNSYQILNHMMPVLTKSKSSNLVKSFLS
jgi:tetratricopeptide (TPR) repeat protein